MSKNFNGFAGLFTKVTGATLAVIALSFGVAANFRGIPADTAKATDTPTETIRAITADDGGDPWIYFDGKSYIDSGVDHIGDTAVRVDFQADRYSDATYVYGARTSQYNNAFTLFADWQVSRYDKFGFYYGGTGSITNTMSLSNEPVDTDRHVATQHNGEIAIDGLTFTKSTITPAVAPSTPLNIYVGAMNGNGNPYQRPALRGKIYSFQMWKNGEQVRDFVPAARYTCGDQNSLQYGFVSDLNSDGIFTDDEWFGNLGTGTLIGSETITVPACPAQPTESKNPESTVPANPAETLPIAQPTTKNTVGTPNTGVAK